MITKTWTKVTENAPCEICGKPDWCQRSGVVAHCCRSTQPPTGWHRLKPCEDGAIFRRDEDRPQRDFTSLQPRFKAQLSSDHRRTLATQLGVAESTLDSIGCGWTGRVYTFPERDASGRVIGMATRTPEGRKKAMKGGKRGLVIPSDLPPDGLVLVPEGASDVAALLTMGLRAVGRPSAGSGVAHLATLLKDRELLVLGENDQKADGTHPGRTGAQRVARSLARAMGRPVRWALPPDGAKDVRRWLKDQEIEMSDDDALQAAGRRLLERLLEAAVEEAPSESDSPATDGEAQERTPSQAELLVRLAERHFRLGRSESDEPFAVEVNGPAIARTFSGSRDAFHAKLARLYREQYGKTPTASALGDALVVLQGMALDGEAEALHVRVAEHNGGVIIDLGTIDGRVVLVKDGAWEVAEHSPVLFRRSALTGVLPLPKRGGDLQLLRGLLNVTDETWPLVVGFLVAALLPTIPHPILLFGGPQGTGKSTAARMVVGLIDPSPAPLRSEPHEKEAWAMICAGSWVVAIDNISSIPGWWSDALCKAVTGDGWVRRRNYTDSDLLVLNYRRVILLTSIDAGALRGDLGERLVLADLEPIGADSRKTEGELDRGFGQVRELVFGALLDALARVLEHLPQVQLAEYPRMADFAKVLAALDLAGVTDGALTAYLNQGGRVASEVVEGDPVASGILGMLEKSGAWSGTAEELLKELRIRVPASRLPKSARALAGTLRRLRSALAALRVETVDEGRSSARGARRWTLRFLRQERSGPSEPSDPPGRTTRNREEATEAFPDRPAGVRADGQPVKPRCGRPTEGTDGTDGRVRNGSAGGISP